MERSRAVAWVVASVCVVAAAGCGGRVGAQQGGAGGAQGASSGGAQGSSSGGLEVALEPVTYEGIAREDRVGASDAPSPDGRADATFTARVRGRVAAFVLTIYDDVGTHTLTQWDTVVGQSELPAGFMHRFGAQTWVLGVVDPQGRLLNAGDGSMPEQNFERPTTVRLFAAMRDTLQAGRVVCLTAIPPDGAPVRASVEVR